MVYNKRSAVKLLMSKNRILEVLGRLVGDTKQNILGGRKVQSCDNWGKL